MGKKRKEPALVKVRRIAEIQVLGEDCQFIWKCPKCGEPVSGPPNAHAMLKCVWCHLAFESFEDDPFIDSLPF